MLQEPPSRRAGTSYAAGPMLLASKFSPDPSTSSQFIAGLWQGPRPGITVERWIYLDTEPRSMLLIWDAATADDRTWLEERLAPFGQLETWGGDEATPGMATAIDRDIDGFRDFMLRRGATQESVAPQLELRRLGMAAATLQEAVAAGKAWSASR